VNSSYAQSVISNGETSVVHYSKICSQVVQAQERSLPGGLVNKKHSQQFIRQDIF